jgi:hypothetical protein
LARLIVIDASVAIAALAVDDAHHAAAAAAMDFVLGCFTVPATAQVADEAAFLQARHRATFDRRWRTVDQRVTIP